MNGERMQACRACLALTLLVTLAVVAQGSAHTARVASDAPAGQVLVGTFGVAANAPAAYSLAPFRLETATRYRIVVTGSVKDDIEAGIAVNPITKVESPAGFRERDALYCVAASPGVTCGDASGKTDISAFAIGFQTQTGIRYSPDSLPDFARAPYPPASGGHSYSVPYKTPHFPEKVRLYAISSISDLPNRKIHKSGYFVIQVFKVETPAPALPRRCRRARRSTRASVSEAGDCGWRVRFSFRLEGVPTTPEKEHLPADLLKVEMETHNTRLEDGADINRMYAGTGTIEMTNTYVRPDLQTFEKFVTFTVNREGARYATGADGLRGVTVRARVTRSNDPNCPIGAPVTVNLIGGRGSAELTIFNRSAPGTRGRCLSYKATRPPRGEIPLRWETRAFKTAKVTPPDLVR